MSNLSTFFKDSDSSLSVFYPLHYMIVTFPSYAAARGAYEALVLSGYSEHEAILATGPEVVVFLEKFRDEKGLWGMATRSLSRFLGGEAINSDVNIADAKEGAGFIAVHCEEESDALKAIKLMEAYKPSSADWYLSVSIQSFMGSKRAVGST